MKIVKKTSVVACPDCDEAIDLGAKIELGQKVTCPYCEAYLEVTSLDPPELGWDMGDLDDAGDWDGDEDWDDDSDWDEDEAWEGDEIWDDDED